jgi:hypothetical protein
MTNPANGPAAEFFSERFLVEADPIVAAEKAYEMLNQSIVDQPQQKVPTISLTTHSNPPALSRSV